MPTDCNAESISFTPLANRAVTAAFDAGAISSDGGVLLLREVDRRINLFDRVGALIPDPRNQLFVEHDQRTMIAQRVLSIACGWEDLNDQDQLRNDLVMQLATGREASGRKPGEGDVDPQRPLASAPTLCRLENRVDRKACVAINQLLCAYLRPSKIDESLHARPILWLIAQRLRQAWPDVRIIFRGDGGFSRPRLMRSCDRRGIKYVIGLPKNKVLNRESAELAAHAEAIFTMTGQKQRLFGEFMYAAGTWDRERRVIARIEHSDKGPNPRYVTTNLDQEKQALYEQTYCGRGEMENRIKEQQLDLFADRTSCHELVANQFRLLLSSMAYVLVETLRRTALAGTELATAQAGTIRLKLLKIGAVVRVSVRRIVVHLSESFPLQDLFRALDVRPSG